MNFTKETPTEPGAYWWKNGESDKRPDLVKVFKRDRELVVLEAGFDGKQPLEPFVGGLWCRLEPAKPKCVWSKQPHDTLFKTACGVHKFLDPGSNEPASNFYCSNCGGEIEIKP